MGGKRESPRDVTRIAGSTSPTIGSGEDCEGGRSATHDTS